MVFIFWKGIIFLHSSRKIICAICEMFPSLINLSRSLSIRRLFLALMAIAITIPAIYYLCEYRSLNRQYYEWVEARPISLPVDLSEPGTYSAPFRQTCSISHGEGIFLGVQAPPDINVTAADIFSGLDATIVIMDSTNKELISRKFGTGGIVTGLEKNTIFLTDLDFIPNGDYTARISISKGASALRGMKQELFAMYMLCGAERIPVVVSFALALVFGIPAVFLCSITICLFYKHGIWRSCTNSKKAA
jgi:hypothetical protein